MTWLRRLLAKWPWSLRFLPIAAVFVLGATSLFFQNCSQNFSVTASSYNLPINHPSISDTTDVLPEPPVVASSKILIGDQRFLESAFREAFLTPQSPSNETGFLDAVLYQELWREQHLLGRGCDPIEGGDNTSCNPSLGNANLGMNASTSSGREAARLQVCRRVIANDVMLARAVGKVGDWNRGPDVASIPEIIRLFYPNTDQDIVDATAAKLNELNTEMQMGGESVLNRWKLMFLTVCESSGWEVL